MNYYKYKNASHLKCIILILMLPGINTALGQTKNLTAIVKEIARIDVVEHEAVGVTGSKGENYKHFVQLKSIATPKELVQLTEHKNATVACYASWALADTGYPDLKTIFEKFMLQDRKVLIFNGCEQYDDNISNELYHRYWNRLGISHSPKDKLLLSLDSIIIFSKKPDWLLLNRALTNRIYKEPYKTQISVLAFEQGQREAIFYLCNWYKAEYKDKIKRALLKYLEETDFRFTGPTDYYKTVEELFKFKDSAIRTAIINKMKSDRRWELDKERFKYLLADNYIYDIDTE